MANSFSSSPRRAAVFAQSSAIPDRSDAEAGATEEPGHSGEDRASLKFGLMLHQVREGLIRRIEARLVQQNLDINFSQFRVLKVLYEGHASTASGIARWVGHDAGALTRLLDRLAERGYLRRQPRTTDRRQVDVVLTAEGRAVSQRIVNAASEAVATALHPLSPGERDALVGMLDRVRRALDRPLHDAGEPAARDAMRSSAAATEPEFAEDR